MGVVIRRIDEIRRSSKQVQDARTRVRTSGYPFHVLVLRLQSAGFRLGLS
jgi:hypothetical protein